MADPNRIDRHTDPCHDMCRNSQQSACIAYHFPLLSFCSVGDAGISVATGIGSDNYS